MSADESTTQDNTDKNAADETGLLGRWQIKSIEYGPGDGQDTEVYSAEDLGQTDSYLDFKEDGTYSSRYWYIDKEGRWERDGKTVTLKRKHDEPTECTFLEERGRLNRPDYDEEHGRDMTVKYVRAES